MSDSDRPELQAFHELERLIRALGEEMAGWRRRALHAESQLKAASHAAGEVPPDPRLAELQRENAELRTRLDVVGQRTRRLLDRMRFLRQQHELEARR